MGAGQSSERPRTITVEAGDASITVTQEFVNYISGSEPQRSDEGSGTYQPTVDDNLPESDYVYTERPPIAEDLLSALAEPQAQSTDAVKWRTLYEEEKKRNEQFEAVTRENIDNAVNDIKQQFAQSKLGDYAPVCVESKEQVLACYRNNPNTTLNCSKEVRNFSQCVEKARKDLLRQQSVQ